VFVQDIFHHVSIGTQNKKSGQASIAAAEIKKRVHIGYIIWRKAGKLKLIFGWKSSEKVQQPFLSALAGLANL
jgi:hypothetical protein